MKPLRVGTRGSALAITQTQQIIDTLGSLMPDVEFEIVTIKTTGDAQRDVPFTSVGAKGMFVKELEEALLTNDIDFAVHSLKDMPSELPSGLALVAVPPRVDPRDAFISDGTLLKDLKPGALVGTSSLRRQAQMRAYRPDLRVDELRGNLDTRMRKLYEGQYDAVILASAGLERMGWSDRIVERLPADTFVPAPGQGALALEARSDNRMVIDLLAIIHSADTADAVEAERGFQAALNAGCTVPAGANATVVGDKLTIKALIAKPDGSRIWRAEMHGDRKDAHSLGVSVAQKLLDDGASIALS